MKYILLILLLSLHPSVNAKPSVIYIDDIGEISGGLNWATAADYNNIQDLIAVLSLDRYMNLHAIGVGISGKRVSATTARSVDVAFAMALTHKHRPNLPVLGNGALMSKIRAVAAVSTPANPLIIAVGGPWYDISMLLDATDGPNAIYPSIKDNIRVIGIGGSNITNAIHRVGGAKEAYDNVVSIMGSGVTLITGAYFLDSTLTRDLDYMRNFYDMYMEPAISGIQDSTGAFVTGPKYIDAVTRLNASFLPGNPLRFGDVTSVLLAIDVNGRWGCDTRFLAIDQECILDIFEKSLYELVNGRDISYLPAILMLLND